MAIADATKRLAEIPHVITRLPLAVAEKLSITDARDIFDRGPARPATALLPNTVVAAIDRLAEVGRVADGVWRRAGVRVVVEALGPECDALLTEAAQSLQVPTRIVLQDEIIDRRWRTASRSLADAERSVAVAQRRMELRPGDKAVREKLSRAQGGVKAAMDNLKVLNQFRTPFVDAHGVAHERQFLAAVPSAGFAGGSNRSGHVVEVFGDLPTARRVLIVVPGVGNRYESFEETRVKAESMMRELQQTYPGESVATIEWMGYEVPGWIQCPGVRAATEGGPVLRDFVDSLRLGPDVEVTLLGHSYGSVVVSEALRSGLRVDRVVFTGSPGVRVRSVEETGLTDDRVFVMAANGDPVSGFVTRLRWHGVNPASEPFGGRRLATDGKGHNSYFKPGTLSIRNLVHVVMGHLDRVVDVGRATEPDAGPELVRAIAN